MQSKVNLPFITLFLMISFASVNAVLFTPSLPDLTVYFAISNDTVQQTITLYLLGYAFGQLVYGPLANRYGRKPALYMGIGLQMVSSLLCVYSGLIHLYTLMEVGRLLLGLGSAVGLKMTFTMISETYEPKIASQKIAYLILGFAIAPGLAVALGGFLNSHYGWQSCFYAGFIYGLILFVMTMRLSETLTPEKKDINALKITHLLKSYLSVFSNSSLVYGGLLMGGATCFVYVFAALAPLIVINLFGLSSQEYGIANLMPPIGIILGSLASAKLAKTMSLNIILKLGLQISCVGVLIMLLAVIMHVDYLYAIFLPMIIIYFGLSFIISNASAVAMSHVSDKANGSAVMNFINMGSATVAVLGIGFFSVSVILLPLIYISLIFLMIFFCKRLIEQSEISA